MFSCFPSLSVFISFMSLSGVTLPCTVLFTMMTGAMLQAPTQFTFSTVNLRSSDVSSPCGNPQLFDETVDQPLGPFDVAGRAAACRDDVLPSRLEVELRVERRDAVEPRRRHIEPFRDQVDRVLAQIAEFALEVLQDRDQVAFVLPVPRQYAFEFFFHDRSFDADMSKTVILIDLRQKRPPYFWQPHLRYVPVVGLVCALVQLSGLRNNRLCTVSTVVRFVSRLRKRLSCRATGYIRPA